MTVTATARRAAYTGNNITTTFAVPFQFLEIAVYRDGVLQTLGVHYTITQSAPGATGSVVFLAAPATGAAIQIVGATVQSQPLDLLDNDSAPAEMYERGLDRLTMIAVENMQQLTQTIRAPAAAAPLPELDFKNNPESFLNTDSNGVPRLSPIAGPTSPLTAQVTTATNAAAAAQTSANNAESYAASVSGVLAAATEAKDQAEAARAVTEGYLDEFQSKFLTPKGDDPTLDDDGNPLEIGTVYYNTTLNGLRVYGVSGWTAAPAGPQGEPGPSVPGAAATIEIGTVTTLAAGSPATVSNSGTSFEATLNFGIPVGQGASVAVGTVTTLTAGSPATVTNTGTSTAAVLNFGIPQGASGGGTVSSVNSQAPVGGNVTLNGSQIATATTADNYAVASATLDAHLDGIDNAFGGASTTVASAATTTVGAAGTYLVDITGTTTITSLGTGVSKRKRLRFAGVLTLTHNATTLILPGNSNIVTAAGDTAEFVSDGSSNWRCVNYTRASQPPITTDGKFTLSRPSATSESFELLARTSIGYPVPYFRPTTANTRCAFDLSPNGAPSVGSGLVTWIDVCNADITATSNLGCARVGVTEDKVIFGSVKYGTVGDLPVEIQVGGADVARFVSNALLIGKSSSSLGTAGCEFSTSGIFYAIADAAAPAVINRLTNDGNLVTWRRDATNVGFVGVSAGVVTYGSFCGGHWSQLSAGAQDILPGTILDSVDEMCAWADEESPHLPKCKISDTAGSKSVYGVFQNYDEDGDVVVASLGALFVRIGAGVSVSRGDLIESAGNGTGRVQTDDIVRASTVAKVTSNSVLKTYADGSYTVPCTLHCG